MVAVIVVVSSPQLASVCCDKILVKTDLPRRKGLFQLGHSLSRGRNLEVGTEARQQKNAASGLAQLTFPTQPRLGPPLLAQAGPSSINSNQEGSS